MVLSIIPFLVILGTLGNILNIMIMLRRKFAKLSISVYLLVLAISDTIFLYTNTLSTDWILYVTDVNIQNEGNGPCKILKYILMTSRCLSAWLIVAVSVERLTAIIKPYSAKMRATPRRARFIVLGITSVVICAYLHILVLVEVTPNGICLWKTGLKNAIPVLFNVYDLILYSLLPSVILLTTSTMLIYKVRQSHKFQAEAANRFGTQQRDHQETVRMSVMLVTVSLTFFFLTLPITLDQTLFMMKIFSPDIVYFTFYLLDVLNHSINFILYMISGKSFRQELNLMFCGVRTHGNHLNSKDTETTTSRQQQIALDVLDTPQRTRCNLHVSNCPH